MAFFAAAARAAGVVRAGPAAAALCSGAAFVPSAPAELTARPDFFAAGGGAGSVPAALAFVVAFRATFARSAMASPTYKRARGAAPRTPEVGKDTERTRVRQTC
ncbi:MAG TPA: hypothetical protein VFM54_13385, partial [Micromonosporaceae bacterium]|nr:hypothetical protein [Micromonosporaceae bacterium]